MAKDEYAPFTGKLDAAPQFEPFDGTLDGEKPKPRNLAAVANDTAIEVANAAAGGVSAAANFIKPGNAVSGWIDKNIIKAGEDSQSDVTKAAKQQFRQGVENADGVMDELGAVGRYVVENPLLSAAQAAGSFVGPGAAVKAFGFAGKAARLGAKGAERAGRAGGVAAGAAMAGGDAAGNAYELSTKAGATEDQAVAAGREASVIPAVIGGVGGMFGAERLLAGARGFAGTTASRAIKTGASEALQEGIEEGVTQYEGQRAAMPFDPSIDPAKGVAAAAGMGAALGGITGAGVSVLTGQDTGLEPPQQPPAAPPAPPQPQAGPALALPAPDPGVIAVGGDGTARTPAYQKPSFAGEYADVTDVVPRALAPQPADPVRAAVESAANSGGALSGAALVAIDSGVTPRQEGAFEDAPELGAQPPQVNLDDLADPYDRAYYESLFDDDPAPLGAPPVLSAFLQNDDDIPDFDAANNVSEEDFLRALGADEQEIQDAIATTPDRAESAPEGAALPAGPQANVTAGTPEGAGAGAEQPAGPVADAPTNLRDALAKVRAQKQEAANAQAAQAPAPAAAPAPGPTGAAAVEAAGVAPQASIQAITAKQIPDMTDAELQAAIVHYGPAHKRTAKLQKEAQRRAALPPQSQPNGAPNVPQADQAQQAAAQPAQAGPAQPAQGLTDAAAAQNHGAQGTPAPGAQAQTSDAAPSDKAKWIKAAVDKSRLNGSSGVQLTVTPQGEVTFSGDPRSTKDGRALLATYEEALRAGATKKEIADALMAASGQGAARPDVTLTNEGDTTPAAAEDSNANQAQTTSQQAQVATESGAPEETREQRAQRVASAGQMWTRMGAIGREALVARALGLNPIQRKRIPSAAWDDLHIDIQRKLADTIDGRVETGGSQAAAATADVQEPPSRTSESASTAPTLQSAMDAAGWTGETGKDDTIWTKEANSDTYTARLTGNSLEVTVPVNGVGTQIASMTVTDPTAAAKAASKAVADDVAESAPAPSPASPAKEAPNADGSTIVGRRADGVMIRQDKNGVRFYTDGGTRISEAVEMRPTRSPNGGIVYAMARTELKPEFMTQAERDAVSPAPAAAPSENANSRPGVVNVPPAIEAAFDADMQAQKARITRLRNDARKDGTTLEEKTSAQTKLRAAETTLVKMRTTRFDAEDAAIKAIAEKDMAPFAEHIAFPRTEKALQALVSQAEVEGQSTSPAVNDFLAGRRDDAPTVDEVKAEAPARDAAGNVIQRPLLTGADRYQQGASMRGASGAMLVAQARVLEYMNGELDRPTLMQALEDSGLPEGVLLSITQRMQEDSLSNGEIDAMMARRAQKTAATPAKAAPTPAKADPLTEREKAAKAKMFGALGKLAALASKNTRMNWTPEEEQALLPIVIELFDGAMELGAVTFKKAVAYVRDFIAQGIDQETADAIPFETLQGAYIAVAGRHKDKGVTAKKEVAGFDSLDELQATAEQAPEGPPAVAQGTETLTHSLYKAIRDGGMPKDNPALKKLVEAFDGKPADPARMKQAQEELETAIAMSARDIVAKGESDKATFDALLRMYESQPNLNIRTSTSVANQAYSTPAPLAFVASRLAGITRDTMAHEPTGGTGMLLIGADPKKALVNELNDLRISALKAQGFAPTQKDATTMLLVPEGTKSDAVVTNPPFGSIKDADGKTVKVKVDGFSIGQIDHLIAARALQTMKDDGKATLILGANKIAGGLSTDDRIFFNWLYSHYNVSGHFEVEGDLYARQGAGWPVRVITINGRQKSGKLAPVAGTIQRADNWSQVYEQFTQSISSASQSAAAKPADGTGERAPVSAAAPAAPGGSRPQGSTGSAGNVAGARPRVVPDSAKPAAEPVGPVPDEQRLNAESFVPQPQPGQEPAGAQRPSKPAGTTAVADAPAAAGNEFQSPYVPRSARKDDGVLIPSNMAQPTQDALNRLEDSVGDIDEFARSELGYATVADLHNALMGLQVDSVATAIYQIKQNKAVVIADQTGIGKGRQAASIIRWAARNGMTPVFVSVKPSLFTDMYGDLADIGTSDVAPFILNSSEWVSGTDGEKLFANKPSTHRAAIQSIVDNAALPQGRNALFMTYSQINTANLQRQALMALAPNAVFVLDESHNAAGDSGTGEFMISVLKEARGVTYLSATYAKRPDNMPLYFKTDIGDAAADSEGLADAMAAGGLPLQTVVSNNLVKAGQMFRRERSYDGVSIASTFDTANRQLHERLSDEATEALRAIVSADKLFHSVFVKSMDKALKAEGSQVQDNAGNQVSAGVQHTEFSSVVHNFVRQMLLGLKAQTAADEAIASLKRGEKPIIAVENTMGSFLSEYAAQNNINQGDSLGAFDYRTVLSRALERSRVINVVLPTGDKSKQNIPLSRLDPITRKAYDQAQAVIDRLAIDIPVSPIDWMRAEIARAGFSVAEITGRDLSVDYSNPRKPVLSAIDPTEQRDKVASTRRFNGGELDALILNVAGSTGISLHASEKFADQRQRHMIVAQAAGDINIFMQMLGRVHRTGQVRLPKYTILSVDLPTEKRPTAVLSRKMKSLNANTSSNTESATSVKTADILNKYGDQIVNQYLVDNLELARQLGVDDQLSSDGERVSDDIARKATGRLALQPIEVQRAFYEDVEAQYDALIEYLNKTNQNDLEPRTFDFDAKEVRTEILFDGPNKTTPFGEDAVYGEYSIKAQGMAMKPEEIQAAIAESLQGKTGAEHAKQMVSSLLKVFTEQVNANRYALTKDSFDEAKYGAYMKSLFQDTNDFWVEQAKQQIAKNGVVTPLNEHDMRRVIGVDAGVDFALSHAIGKTFRVEINSEPYNAVITNVRNTHKTTGNPFSLSKFQITIAVNGALRSITVPATQFKKIEVSSIAPAFRIETLFKEQPANQRETAKIVTGNLLAAYGEIKGARGTIISFTKADGVIEQGILLPKLFDFSKNTQGDYRLRSGADALKFLQQSTNKDIGRFGIATRDGQVRVLPRGDGVQVRVPKSKAQGARYFLDKNLIAVAGDFVSSANAMVANVDDAASAAKVLDLLMDKQALYALPSMADEAKSMAAKKDAGSGKADGPEAIYSSADSTLPAKPLSLDRVNQLVQEALSGIRGTPPVKVTANPADIGLKVPAGSVGYGVTLRSGDIYVFQSAMGSDLDVFKTVFHELFHRGVRVLVPKAQYVQTMLDLAKGDSRIQQLAIEWKNTEMGQKQKENLREQGYTGAELTGQYEALAIEEALAAVAEEIKAQGRLGSKPKSMTIRFLANWLAKLADLAGMKKLAQGIRAMTYNEAERFVMSAIDRSGEPVQAGRTDNMSAKQATPGTDQTQTEAAFSRGTNEAMTNNDVVGNQGGRSADDTTPGDLLRKLEGTQVVDPNGAPLLVYHGSKSQIDRFDASKTIDGGLHFGSKSQASMRSSKILHPAYLYAENLRRSKDTGSNWKAKIASAKAAGYDGIVYLNRYEGVSKETVFRLHSQGLSEKLDRMSDAEFRRAVPEAEDSYIVFDAKQVIQQNESSAPDSGGAAFSRTATGNKGDFDPANADIRFRSADMGSKARDELANAAGAAIKSVTATNIKQRAGFKLTDYLGLGLQALGRRQIVDVYGDMLPLAEYNTLVQQMEADKNEGGAEADKLVTRWADLPDEGKLADLMHEATLAQIDPAKPYVNGDDKAKHTILAGRFNALSQEARQVYTDTRDAYQGHHAKVRSAIKERIERSELKGPRKAELLKQMDDEFFAAVKGVYFPLARFGQYAVTVKGADGKVESVSRAETKAEAEALRNNLLSAFPRDKGFTVGRVMLSKDFIADRDAVGRGFMTELYQVLDKQDMDAAQRAELEDTLGQLYLSSLPDLSWAKHGIHRKGTPGFSQDARRAYAQNMFHGSRYLAKLRYSDLMQDELTAMQKHVDDWREVEDFDQNSAQRVVDEMNKRHESLMNPKSNPLSTALTSFGFVFHLGLSPASAMVNLSQTALVAYPIMGAKWGFGKASAALLKASAEATKGKNDITGSLNADERAAYDEAVRAGTIDVTMAHDLAGIAQGEDAGVMWKIRPVMRWASFLFHHAERFNRQVTFVASYRLAREAGADQKAAFEQATKATYDGHFDYGAANRPRVMQGNVAKVLLLFKQYGQNMVYTLSRNAYQSIKGTDAEKAEARKVLAGLLTSHAMAAGVLGLPMVTTLLAAASMLGGDDDEPWDAKVALQNMLADTFGQKPAEVLAHGLSRLTPWDISGRVGLDKLIFPDVQEGLEGQRLWESAATQALGPVGGIFGGLLKGLDLMSDGHYLLGLEAMLPAVLRQAVKSVRYATDGAQDMSGVSIKDEVSTPAVVGQLLGFSPSEVRLAQEGKSAIYQQDKALAGRRQELLTKAARATMAKDAEARAEAMKEIQRFNQKNPTRRITPLNVLQSARNRQKRIDQAQDGVYLPKNRRDAMEAGRFALGG